MAEDLGDSLQTYKVHLEQVENSLHEKFGTGVEQCPLEIEVPR